MEHVSFVILHYVVYDYTIKCINSILNNIEYDNYTRLNNFMLIIKLLFVLNQKKILDLRKEIILDINMRKIILGQVL